MPVVVERGRGEKEEDTGGTGRRRPSRGRRIYTDRRSTTQQKAGRISLTEFHSTRQCEHVQAGKAHLQKSFAKHGPRGFAGALGTKSSFSSNQLQVNSTLGFASSAPLAAVTNGPLVQPSQPLLGCSGSTPGIGEHAQLLSRLFKQGTRVRFVWLVLH